MTMSNEQVEYLSNKRIADFMHRFFYLLKKYEPWNNPSAVAACKEVGIDLEKLARVDLSKIGWKVDPEKVQEIVKPNKPKQSGDTGGSEGDALPPHIKALNEAIKKGDLVLPVPNTGERDMLLSRPKSNCRRKGGSE